MAKAQRQKQVNKVEQLRLEDGEESKMGSVGSSVLQPIKINPNWAYQPDENTDLNDVVKNPIPFVGNGNDWKIGEILENDTKQTEYDGSFVIDISKVKTLQPFILKSGVINYQRFDDTEKPYVAEYNGNYYLLDGNHRMAKAKLDGKKTMEVILSRRVKR